MHTYTIILIITIYFAYTAGGNRRVGGCVPAPSGHGKSDIYIYVCGSVIGHNYDSVSSLISTLISYLTKIIYIYTVYVEYYTPI